MKQYTTPDQTAKLIELGFEKPKNEVKAEQAGDYAWYNSAYSIGELIEIMGYDLYSIHYKGLAWEVKSERIETREAELIDALYDMIVKLKKEKNNMIDLIHGDCLVEMAKIPDKSIDCVICDLPYGTTACKWDVSGARKATVEEIIEHFKDR